MTVQHERGEKINHNVYAQYMSKRQFYGIAHTCSSLPSFILNSYWGSSNNNIVAAKNKRALFLILRIEIKKKKNWNLGDTDSGKTRKVFWKKFQRLVKAKAARLYSDTEK